MRALGEIARPITRAMCPQDHENSEQEHSVLYVTYDGKCALQKRQKGKYMKPSEMLVVREGDLVFSNIRATDGAIGIVPKEFDGALVSYSFTVLRCSSREDTVYLWSVMRSFEIRADIMSISTGTGRYNTDWELAKAVQIPWLSEEKRRVIATKYESAWEHERAATIALLEAANGVEKLGLNSEQSKSRFSTYKPPK